MQKILFGIFAHPDDEAFGPCGTLLTEVEAGTELHLITLTAGENGTNPDNLPNLGEVRLNEWHKAGELIGATSMHHFGYTDGMLSNLNHLEITDRLIQLVTETVADREDYEVEFMTLDLNGLTGHVDHIVAARSACLAFYRLRDQGLSMSRIRLYCLSHDDVATRDTTFVFMEPGRTKNEIVETIDASKHLPQIRDIMHCHHTQRADCDAVMEKLGDRIAVNHFLAKY